MPMLQVNLLSGYSDALKGRLSKALTAVIGGITKAKPEAISVWINEFNSEDYSRGGEIRKPGSGTKDPSLLVQSYLTAMEQRQLDTAQSYLSDNFVMTFPGSAEFSSLNQLVEWSQSRYRFVQKTLDSVTVAYEMEAIQVFVIGTLAGELPDGSAFKNVRFIDRFEVRDDVLVRQDVWNDLAEIRR
ncbi:nuclear transport factor 2 family protein [Marinobacter sp. F3R08]|uniref:nuclear transport factor 2 family protein n=1 Tax=Marinobacter sp. F3R08 TaxID=2841559 RepID=UPI001C0910A1|nr:tautomerase family protein [Marinobacter sp. F3R08]MBU2954776.1 tautomerase family protein [Marinobacter sp. F3R08]